MGKTINPFHLKKQERSLATLRDNKKKYPYKKNSFHAIKQHGRSIIELNASLIK
jgi:hypothetical protein